MRIRSRKGGWIGAFLLSVFLVTGCDSYQSGEVLASSQFARKQTNDPRNTTTCEITEQQQHMLDIINQARAEGRSCGDDYYSEVSPLTWSCQLRDVAIHHTVDMATHNYFAHEGLDGSHAGDRITAIGYNWRYYGENLAAGYVLAEDALVGLLDSPGHCKNIMNGKVTEFGSYRMFVEDMDYQSYWTHVFAHPM